jgi:hypothetical protein
MTLKSKKQKFKVLSVFNCEHFTTMFKTCKALSQITHECNTYSWICFDFKVVGAKVALHAELVDRCSIIHALLRLLCIVAYTHAYVTVTAITPYVVGHFKSENGQTIDI